MQDTDGSIRPRNNPDVCVQQQFANGGAHDLILDRCYLGYKTFRRISSTSQDQVLYHDLVHFIWQQLEGLGDSRYFCFAADNSGTNAIYDGCTYDSCKCSFDSSILKCNFKYD